jgi:hypothetical protein
MAASCRDSLEQAEAGRRQGLQGWGICLRSVTTQPRPEVDIPLSHVKVPKKFRGAFKSFTSSFGSKEFRATSSAVATQRYNMNFFFLPSLRLLRTRCAQWSDKMDWV